MDQAPGLLALQDRGPGFALLPGAARRSAPPLTKEKRKVPKKESSQKKKVHVADILFFSMTVVHFLEQRYCIFLLTCGFAPSPFRFGASVP